MALRVSDFPASQRDKSQTGQGVLVTQRELRAGDQPMKRARIMLDNIPTEGPPSGSRSAISAITMSTGLYVAFEQEKDETGTGQENQRQEGPRRPRHRTRSKPSGRRDCLARHRTRRRRSRPQSVRPHP